MQQLIAWLNSHGVHPGYLSTLVIGFAVRHYWPIVKEYATTKGVDVAIMKLLVEMNILLRNAGATDDEVKQVNLTVSQIALRAAQDIEKDIGVAPPAQK